jgi:hypothetical protein
MDARLRQPARVLPMVRPVARILVQRIETGNLPSRDGDHSGQRMREQPSDLGRVAGRVREAVLRYTVRALVRIARTGQPSAATASAASARESGPGSGLAVEPCGVCGCALSSGIAPPEPRKARLFCYVHRYSDNVPRHAWTNAYNRYAVAATDYI